MRYYDVTFENVSVSAAQDLVQITGATGKMMFICEMWVGCPTTTLPRARAFAFERGSCRRLSPSAAAAP